MLSNTRANFESARVVYPLLLNYGLSAVGVDSFTALLMSEAGLGFHLP
jgi:hypothetical protein